MSTKYKLMIATPSIGDVPWPYLLGLIGLNTHGPWVMRRVFGKQGVARAWNDAIEEFLNTGIEWMLHLDSDAVVHPETLTRLWSWGVPLVSALAFQRRGPIMPVVYMGPPDENGKFYIDHELVFEWCQKHPEILQLNVPVVLEPRPDDALIKVDRTGSHCLLVHRSVYEAVGYPWFTNISTNPMYTGSDFDFHAKAQAAGFTSYVDLSCVSGHIMGEWMTGAIDFLAWKAITQFVERDTDGGADDEAIGFFREGIKESTGVGVAADIPKNTGDK